MIKLKSLILTLSLFGFFIFYSNAQESSGATISGQIVDYLSGEPLPFSLAVLYEATARDSSREAEAWLKGS